MNMSTSAIERLHRDLPTIRNVAGWSADHLAKLLEVSRVTVVNLENLDRKMSKIQYLAIRALLQDEIDTNQNSVLADVVTVLVDRDNVSETIKQNLRDQIERTAKSTGRKAGIAAVAKNVGPTIAKMKLSEIPDSTILRGQAKQDEILTRSAHKK